MSNQILHVRIISPQELILETEAEAVSSKNIRGDFDILPEHANFITVVENYPILIRVPKQKPIILKFNLAIIMVTENNVNIYTYIQPQVEKR